MGTDKLRMYHCSTTLVLTGLEFFCVKLDKWRDPSLISKSLSMSNFYAMCMSVLYACVCAPSECLLPAEVRRELPESLELEFQTT